jgi:hypothetical protein
VRAWPLFPSLILGVASLCAAQPCSPHWSAVGENAFGIWDIVVHDDGSGSKLYANAGTANSKLVTRWNGQYWEPILTGYPNPASIVVGQGLTSLNPSSSPIATPLLLNWAYRSGLGWIVLVWDGQQWNDAPAWMSQVLSSFEFDDGNGPNLYGIRYDPSLPNQNGSVARLEGTQWVQIGQSMTQVTTIVACDVGRGPELFILAQGLGFGQGGHRAAYLDDGVWRSLGGPPGVSNARAMVALDDGGGQTLFVGGNASSATNYSTTVRKWDRTLQEWTTPGLGVTSPLPGIAQVNVMHAFDDGSGPALFVGGYIQSSPGLPPLRGIAKWDGQNWSNLGRGFNGPPDHMAVYNDGRGDSLFITGNFTTAGAGSAFTLAQWVGCNGQCYPNCDNSTTPPRLNIGDFTCFLRKFADNDPYADGNMDGQLDIADFAHFLQKFTQGCP